MALVFFACQKDFELASSDLQRLGNAARNLLSDEKYKALKVEIAYMPGYAPDAQSLQQLQTFLNTHLNKPGGIQLKQTALKSSGQSRLSVADLVLLEKQNRSVFTNGQTIAVYFLITNAPFSEEGVLATSYWNTSVALFGPTLHQSAGQAGQVPRQKLLAILLQHEAGHLLGLVGQGSPMQQDHRDWDNGAHCNNPECLMYYGIETADFGSSSFPGLDANCLADLRANGGK